MPKQHPKSDATTSSSRHQAASVVDQPAEVDIAMRCLPANIFGHPNMKRKKHKKQTNLVSKFTKANFIYPN